MSAVELSRAIGVETIGETPRRIEITASPEERAALAARFALVDVARLEAVATLRRTGTRIEAEGRIVAEVTQACVVTAEPVAARIATRFALSFTPSGDAAGDEIELSAADLDVVHYDGATIDLGKAMAEELALALDPYPRSAQAADALKAAGVIDEEEARRAASPFAVLKDPAGRA